jgi:hypothetical protein
LHLISETMGSGLAWIDYDGDGWPDLFCVQDGPLPPAKDPTKTHKLYRNNGDGTFSDVTEEAGLSCSGWSTGACFVDYDRVDIREMAWGPNWQFSLHQPDLMHVQSLTWNKSSVTAGDSVQLRIDAVSTFNRSVTLEAVEVDPGGAEEPIPLAALGLPASVPLTGSVTTLDWVARAWPDPEGPDPNAEIVVRLTDHTASSPPLTVAPTAWVWEGGRNIHPHLVPFSASRVGFRALARTPLGETALLIDLPEATAARLELFDLAGRRVRSLADRTLPAGATVIPWDERDGDGAHARPGVYFARLTTPQARHTVRVLVRD